MSTTAGSARRTRLAAGGDLLAKYIASLGGGGRPVARSEAQKEPGGDPADLVAIALAQTREVWL